MKKILFFMLLIVLFSCPVFAGAPENPEYAENQVIVSIAAPAFDDYEDMAAYKQALFEQSDAFAKKYGLEVGGEPLSEIAKSTGKNIFLLISENKSTEELMELLSSDPNVIDVEPNYALHLDPDPEPIGCNAGYGSILLLLYSLALSTSKRK
ncbi:MAG: hypothetical protein FWF87_05465 [Synergistaceae bacterium]|nr:hypothetical protein [Synergistaceae bacterium]